MRDRISRSLRISTAGMVFSGYLALVSVLTYPVFLVFLPVIMVLFGPSGERFDLRHTWYRTITTAVNIAVCCFIPLMLVTLGRLNAVLVLVMYIQFYLMLHTKRPRDYYYIYLMSFFLLLGACFQSPEPVIAVVLLLAIVSSVWAFVSLRAHEDLHNSAGAIPADIVPLGSSWQVPSPDAKNPFDWGFVGWVMAIVLVSLASTGIIFVGTPRIEAGVFGRSNVLQSTTGLTQQVDLRGGNYVQEDPTPVMRVTFPDAFEGKYTQGELYWRVTTMSRFEGASWTRKPLDHHEEPGTGPFIPRDLHQIMLTNPLEAVRKRREAMPLAHQQVYLTDTSGPNLPVLDRVQKVTLNTPRDVAKVYWDGYFDFTLKYASQGQNQFSYDAWSEVGERTPAELRQVSPDYGEMSEEDFALLTEHPLLLETQQLATRIASGQGNIYDKATAIRNYLSGPNFIYTMAIPAMNREFMIDDFINRVRAGHCEFFASAMALMLRSQGIPARVVSGYRGGEWSEADGAYLVRKSMAHLWVEVLFPGVGWVRFDPAPREDFSAPTGMRAIVSSVQRTILDLQIFWFQEVVGFNRGITLDQFRNVALRLFGREGVVDSDDPVPGENSGRRAPYYLRQIPVPLSALVVVLLAGWLGRTAIRKRGTQRALTNDQRRAAKLYRLLLERLKKFGIDGGGRTAEEILEELLRFPELDATSGGELIAIYNEVRFGGRSMSAARFTELRQRIKAFTA